MWELKKMKEIVSESAQLVVDTPSWYRALSLTERLRSFQSLQAPEQSELDGRKMHRWKEQEAFKKGVDFAERLTADHLTECDFLMLLAETDEMLRQRTPTPAWLLQLIEIFAGPDAPEAESTLPGKLSLLNTADIFIQYGRDRLQKAGNALADRYDVVPFDI